VSISDQTRRRWAEKARFLSEHIDVLTAWERALLGSVIARLKQPRDISIQQSISLTNTYDRVQRKLG
jgi:hypothetical protein